MTSTHAGHGSPEIGVISGFTLKVLRNAASHTQSSLAEQLKVDVSTIQGWESGRRPLTALRAADLIRLQRQLISLGVSPNAAGILHDAVDADAALTAIIHSDGVQWTNHPLATSVHRRTLFSLLTWPFTGARPSALQHLPPLRDRGPVSDRPLLDTSEQAEFFDNLLFWAQRARRSEQGLLRRQATYLLGFDRRHKIEEWLSAEYARAFTAMPRDNVFATAIHGRSAALGLARRGDYDPLFKFIDATSTEYDRVMLHLTYWAYWLGEISTDYADDYSMFRFGQNAWVGNRVFEHLLHHLDDSCNGALNIFGLSAVVAIRPHLLHHSVELRAEAIHYVEKTLDKNLEHRAKHDLNKVRYALRLAER